VKGLHHMRGKFIDGTIVDVFSKYTVGNGDA
jgi:hypothetical protein